MTHRHLHTYTTRHLIFGYLALLKLLVDRKIRPQAPAGSSLHGWSRLKHVASCSNPSCPVVNYTQRNADIQKTLRY
jgi:hypothetical protein